MSMKPGVTAQPDASSSRSPRRFGAISRMTPSAIATSAARPGAPVPSKTVPPRITMSAGIGAFLSVDHELEEVAVGVEHVHTRRVGLTTDWPLDGLLVICSSYSDQ